MQYIVFIVGEWGYTKGGINVFNRSVCEAIGQKAGKDRQQVICMAQDLDEETRIKDSETYGLSLVGYIAVDFNKPTSLISILRKNVPGIEEPQNQVVWIGHDIKTGPAAYECSREFGKNSKFAVIHHMSYKQYYMLVNMDAEECLKKEKEQEEILKKADIIFANGPLLARSAKGLIGDMTTKIVELKPGLSDVTPVSTVNADFSVVTFGRIESASGTKRNNSIIKQIYLAACSWAGFYKGKPRRLESQLRIYGFDTSEDKSEIEEFNRMIDRIANAAAPVMTAPYTEKRNEFLKNLANNSLCLFLSLKEGFGLAGLEAISAGVPLILSDASGLFEALQRDNLDNYVTAVQIDGSKEHPFYSKQDLERTVKCIRDVYDEYEKKKKDALALIGRLREKGYTWSDCSAAILDSLFELYGENNDVASPVEDFQKEDDSSRNFPADVRAFKEDEKITMEKVIKKLKLDRAFSDPRKEAERILENWENEGKIEYKGNGEFTQRRS